MSLFKFLKLSGFGSAVKMLFAGFGLMLAALAFALPAQAAAGKAASAKGGETMLVLTVDAGGRTGKVYIKLRPDLAPKNVAQVETLVKKGAYNDVVFHRVIDGFMAQTGDVQYGNRKHYDEQNVGTGGSEELGTVQGEFTAAPFVRGTVGMARTQNPDSASSQFFICYTQQSSLDNQYTVIGNVVKGMDYIDRLKKGDPNNGGKVEGKPDYIVKAELTSEMPKAAPKAAAKK